MSQQPPKGDAIEAPQRQLQIEEDLKFQQCEWKVQFAGWIAMGVLIILASLGLFGTGPSSSSTAQGDDLNLNYERFARLEQPTDLRFQLGGETKEPARLFIERAYLDAVKIEGNHACARQSRSAPGLARLRVSPRGSGGNNLSRKREKRLPSRSMHRASPFRRPFSRLYTLTSLDFRRRRLGVFRRRQPQPEAARVNLGELRAEEKYQRRVINPQQ